jgi:VWFA-related protein
LISYRLPRRFSWRIVNFHRSARVSHALPAPLAFRIIPFVWGRMSTKCQVRRAQIYPYHSGLIHASIMRTLLSCVLIFMGFLPCAGVARAESAVPQSAPAASPAPAAQPQPQTSSAELNSHEEPTTFKVNVKLVLVRVVARDAQGHTIGSLRKEDFQVFDNRKPQVITQFSVEQPGAQVTMASKSLQPDTGESPSEKGKTPAVPERYIAYVFDDVHLKFTDLAQVRIAADHHLVTLQPTDRVAIFSTSGQTTLDFTDDRAQLHKTLDRLLPRPVASTPAAGCPDVSHYMGDLIANKNDLQAISVATQDALNCEFNGDQRQLAAAQSMALAAGRQALEAGDAESRLSLGVLRDVVRRISVMPGQRSIVLVSPGFLTPQLESEYVDLIDRALRSQIIINALDARGLYVVDPAGDIANPPRGVAGISSAFVGGNKLQYQIASASAEADVMAVLADGTGGTFFQNSNDMNEGFRRVSSTPEYYYVLAFTPQNLKLDGSFHSLKVTLKSPEKLTLQARRGYYAPTHAADAAEQAKQEIEDAIFSQEEMHDLPVELHTQFFKSSDAAAKLTVLAHVDVKLLHFQKVEGRNRNDLTVVSALFDRNGNYVEGHEEILEMRWKDATLQNKLGSGITLKASFDVKPGSYLVRLVVRDKEGQMMSAENGAVQIP